MRRIDRAGRAVLGNVDVGELGVGDVVLGLEEIPVGKGVRVNLRSLRGSEMRKMGVDDRLRDGDCRLRVVERVGDVGNIGDERGRRMMQGDRTMRAETVKDSERGY